MFGIRSISHTNKKRTYYYAIIINEVGFYGYLLSQNVFSAKYIRKIWRNKTFGAIRFFGLK